MTLDEFIRQRQAREIHPDGTFDKHGRWFPSAAERCGCCDIARPPSKKYPYNYLVHCRGAIHARYYYEKHGLTP